MNLPTTSLKKKYKHAKKFGITDNWNRHTADKFKKVLLEFINSEETEVMEAFYRKEPATIYIDRRTTLCVIEIDGRFRSCWELGKDQMEAFLKSGNLN